MSGGEKFLAHIPAISEKGFEDALLAFERRMSEYCHVEHLRKDFLFDMSRIRDCAYRLTDEQRGFIHFALYGNTSARIIEEGPSSESLTKLLHAVLAYASDPTEVNLHLMMKADFFTVQNLRNG